MHYPVLSGAKSFRLLTIMPGFREENIATRIFTAELPVVPGKMLHYDALSYVWGNQADKRQISCNGQSIEVTQNLHSAFVQLRSEHDEHVIWIDQLCINQDDPEERSREVAIMGQIYSQAKRVIVWLGSSDSETSKIFVLFHKLLKLREFEASEVYYLALGDRSHQTVNSAHGTRDDDYHGDDDNDARTIVRPRFPPGTASIWKAVERFLDRPWFHRVWTFQEVVLSNACTVYCGPCRISWSDLSDACQAIEHGGFDPYIGSKHYRVTLVQNQRDILHAGERSSLRYMLVLNRDRDATDPRDNVYALRGMLDEVVAHSIHVDYCTSLGEVYAKAAKTSIKQDGNLAVLGAVEYRRTEESRFEMPSWVPDWRYRGSTNVDLSMRRHNGSTYFNASNGERPRVILYSEPRKLGLKGFSVAILTRFSEVKKWLEFGLYETGQQRFPDERFQVSRWKEMYSNAAKQITFPFASLRDGEHPDEITASLWGKATDDSLDDHQAIEMAYPMHWYGIRFRGSRPELCLMGNSPQINKQIIKTTNLNIIHTFK